jgi:histidinol dehydrogenase
MKVYTLDELSSEQLDALVRRPAIDFNKVSTAVYEIISKVKADGDDAIVFYTEQFDGIKIKNIKVDDSEISNAKTVLGPEVKEALTQAYRNIHKFHKAQLVKPKTIETQEGVFCSYEFRPIEKVGLYIPGGSAPLPSTVLMLGVPAQIAGCREITLCTPPDGKGSVPPSILFCAELCGIKNIFKVGGAQAVAAMAYGTYSIPKADKIFGPGNQYVTASKMAVSVDPDGAAIDMPAGPSEVLVIADKNARTDFVAADLLSQAEHGPDSQSILVCTDSKKSDEIIAEVKRQLATLPRKSIATKALDNSFALVVGNFDQAFRFSNDYAPEHLIINVKNPERYKGKVLNAGSVFLGQYSPESAGDYASGTNHSLPTYGYAKTFSGVGLDSFMKRITFQELSEKGAKKLAPTVIAMANEENLAAHRRAMEIRQ